MHHLSTYIKRVTELLPSSRHMNSELFNLKFRSTCLEKGCEILREGAYVAHVVAIGHGLAMRYRLLPDGSRQVFMFLRAGDICNPHIYPTIMDHSVAAVTEVGLDIFKCEGLVGLTTTVVGFNEALWILAEEQNIIMRDRITSLGRCDARARVLMLLKELCLLLSVHGSGSSPVFIPVTQPLLADAVGVTHIHFNRIVGDLAKRGMIATSRGGIIVNNFSNLERFRDSAIVAA